MKIGDTVKFISSPYFNVKINSITKIENIKYNHFGFNCHLYVLSNISHKNFRKHELELIKE